MDVTRGARDTDAKLDQGRRARDTGEYPQEASSMAVITALSPRPSLLNEQLD